VTKISTCFIFMRWKAADRLYSALW
jgi:hypothetical protein